MKGLFNHYDVKVHSNMSAQLQELCIQLSNLDGRLQKIFQDMLRDIRQSIRNFEVNNQLENDNTPREEKTYEILNSFLTWR
ncbi:1290_t:CDS:1, partial [Racocetra fulgida]